MPDIIISIGEMKRKYVPDEMDTEWPTSLLEELANEPRGGVELKVNRLAVFADALEESGAGAEILGHLRSTDLDVRGCWPVDLLLGKE